MKDIFKIFINLKIKIKKLILFFLTDIENSAELRDFTGCCKFIKLHHM